MYGARFNTLWIYTALKPVSNTDHNCIVSIPSEFTLLSNGTSDNFVMAMVSIPSEFTLLSNHSSNQELAFPFQYPLNLHCSQTTSIYGQSGNKFQYPLNLHCSQTHSVSFSTYFCFNTLWIYTALKQNYLPPLLDVRFNTLWIYTALKHIRLLFLLWWCFNTLWIYTALKPDQHRTNFLFVSIPSEFTLLSNLFRQQLMKFQVSIPSEFTLLSNFSDFFL